MAYPREFCSSEVIGESVNVQVLKYSINWYVVHLQTGQMTEIGESIATGRIRDARYALTPYELQMLKECKAQIESRNPTPRLL